MTPITSSSTSAGTVGSGFTGNAVNFSVTPRCDLTDVAECPWLRRKHTIPSVPAVVKVSWHHTCDTDCSGGGCVGVAVVASCGMTTCSASNRFQLAASRCMKASPTSSIPEHACQPKQTSCTFVQTSLIYYTKQIPKQFIGTILKLANKNVKT
ncbi:hypothetical protein E2C01_021784 [Portunus trituberculatus]|uniref:Uncharacterized protein n=1 Tax=Portunus trituberculatus TaxID=210409 RepID=A0A5B7E5U6_PORTR|nr:hypothetical protein [Portunus trituberculatus]